MKTSITVAFTFATLSILGSTVGHCGGPFARFVRCKARPTCIPVSNCATATSSCNDVMMDQPSELNILLTTELVALRKQVDEMKVASAEKDQAMEEANQLIAQLRDQSGALKKRLANQTKRAKKAEDELVKTQKAAVQAEKAARQVAAKANEELNQLKQRNAMAKERLENAKDELQKANKALAEEKKDREEERRQQEKAIETPPAAVKEEGTATDAGGDATPEGE